MNFPINIKLFHWGIANDDAVKAPSLSRDLGVLGMTLINAVRIPHVQCMASGDVMVVNGPRQSRLAKEFGQDGHIILLVGRSASRSAATTPSPLALLSRVDRLCLFWHALLQLGRGLRPRHLGHFLEFSTLATAIQAGAPKRVSAFGHYDRYSTWLAGLCAVSGIPFRIIQHGALSAKPIPHGLPCREVLCYNREEEALFRQYIVENPGCLYDYRRPAGIRLSMGAFHQRPVIAIASQVGYSARTMELLRHLDASLSKCTIIIYLHHLEDANQTYSSTHDNQIRVEPDLRFADVDVLITYFSSIVYDYLYCDEFKGEIICWSVPNIHMAFYSNNRVKLVGSLGEVVSTLPSLTE